MAKESLQHIGPDWRHPNRAGHRTRDKQSRKRSESPPGHIPGVPRVFEMHMHGISHASRHGKGTIVFKASSFNVSILTKRLKHLERLGELEGQRELSQRTESIRSSFFSLPGIDHHRSR